jgi:hypothetical protein
MDHIGEKDLKGFDVDAAKPEDELSNSLSLEKEIYDARYEQTKRGS